MRQTLSRPVVEDLSSSPSWPVSRICEEFNYILKRLASFTVFLEATSLFFEQCRRKRLARH